MNKKLILLIVGIFTISFICASDYPAPFVESGESDTAVVYGTGASGSDSAVATNLNTDLSGSVTAPTIKDSDITNIINSEEEKLSEEKTLWSEKQICNFLSGCAMDGKCYQIGYRTEGQYCSDKYRKLTSTHYLSGFLNQTESGELCNNSFECESNFCFNKKCVSKIESLIASVMNKISTLEWKVEKNGNYMEKEFENNQNASLQIETAMENEENFAIKLWKFFRR